MSLYNLEWYSWILLAWTIFLLMVDIPRTVIAVRANKLEGLQPHYFVLSILITLLIYFLLP